MKRKPHITKQWRVQNKNNVMTTKKFPYHKIYFHHGVMHIWLSVCISNDKIIFGPEVGGHLCTCVAWCLPITIHLGEHLINTAVRGGKMWQGWEGGLFVLIREGKGLNCYSDPGGGGGGIIVTLNFQLFPDYQISNSPIDQIEVDLYVNMMDLCIVFQHACRGGGGIFIYSHSVIFFSH